MERSVIKGTRWLLLTAKENLDEEKGQVDRLQKALEINRPLATVYYMKEDLRQFWFQKDMETSVRFLEDWIARAIASGHTMLNKFANTLIEHWDGLVAYYNHFISTGPLEGINNKIKTMKRQAYGFRDKEFFKLKIMALHTTRYALVG